MKRKYRIETAPSRYFVIESVKLIIKEETQQVIFYDCDDEGEEFISGMVPVSIPMMRIEEIPAKSERPTSPLPKPQRSW